MTKKSQNFHLTQNLTQFICFPNNSKVAALHYVFRAMV
jgi:hypothetical protein